MQKHIGAQAQNRMIRFFVREEIVSEGININLPRALPFAGGRNL